MISAISWVPKGASKAVPSAADPPSKEEIEEIKKTVLVEQGYGLGGYKVTSVIRIYNSGMN